MCVIALCEKSFPSDESLTSMEQLNGHGGGIAWIENRQVKWEKGIDSKRMIKMINKGIVKLPAIIHFRIRSSGNLDKGLCHPFPITDNVPLDEKGTCNTGVLFHNGTYHDYKELCLKAVVSSGKPFLDGELSDSRAITWLVNNYGETILNLIEGFNKFAILTPNGIKKYGDGWTKHKEIQVSNDFFDRGNKDLSSPSYYGDSYEEWKEKHGNKGIIVYSGGYTEKELEEFDRNIKESFELSNGLDTLDDPLTMPEEILNDVDMDLLPVNMVNAKKVDIWDYYA